MYTPTSSKETDSVSTSAFCFYLIALFYHLVRTPDGQANEQRKHSRKPASHDTLSTALASVRPSELSFEKVEFD